MLLALQSCLSESTEATELSPSHNHLRVLPSVLNYKQNVWQCHTGEGVGNITGGESWLYENTQRRFCISVGVANCL